PERLRGTGSSCLFRRADHHETAAGRSGSGGRFAPGDGHRRHPRPGQEAGQGGHDRAAQEQGRQVPLQRPRRGGQVPRPVGGSAVGHATEKEATEAVEELKAVLATATYVSKTSEDAEKPKDK